MTHLKPNFTLVFKVFFRIPWTITCVNWSLTSQTGENYTCTTSGTASFKTRHTKLSLFFPISYTDDNTYLFWA